MQLFRENGIAMIRGHAVFYFGPASEGEGGFFLFLCQKGFDFAKMKYYMVYYISW